MMNARQFYDWQTSGGADDVLRLVDCLERAGVEWCAIGGVAVNHWAAEPMVTRDVDLVVALNHIDLAVAMLETAGFASKRFPWSVNLTGRSAVSVQISTEDFYCDFPRRAVAADVHGILMRVASIEDTLAGKIKAWSEPSRQPSTSVHCSKVRFSGHDPFRSVPVHRAATDWRGDPGFSIAAEATKGRKNGNLQCVVNVQNEPIHGILLPPLPRHQVFTLLVTDDTHYFFTQRIRLRRGRRASGGRRVQSLVKR